MSHDNRITILTRNGKPFSLNADKITFIYEKNGFGVINLESGDSFQTDESYEAARIILDPFEIFPSIENEKPVTTSVPNTGKHITYSQV